VGPLVEAHDEVLQVGRLGTFEEIGQHHPAVHQLGEIGGVAGRLRQVLEHVVDVGRPFHGGQEVTEAAGDLQPQPVVPVGPADQVPLVGQGPDQVVGGRQGELALKGDLLDVEPGRVLTHHFEDPERPRDALDQVGWPLRQHAISLL
jgi:hypothetical protein